MPSPPLTNVMVLYAPLPSDVPITAVAPAGTSGLTVTVVPLTVTNFASVASPITMSPPRFAVNVVKSADIVMKPPSREEL